MSLPEHITSNPSSGTKLILAAALRQIIAFITALSSFRFKYMWPDAGLLKPETSPLTFTYPKLFSRVPLIES